MKPSAPKPSPSPLAAVSSPDLNAERLAALKKLFPDLFSNDGRLNVDELKKVVDPALVSEAERYDFRWYGKTKSKRDGFMLDYTLTRQPEFTKNEVFLAKDAFKESLVCLDSKIAPETVDHFKAHKDRFFICLELALDTTRKWNLKHNLGEKLKAF